MIYLYGSFNKNTGDLVLPMQDEFSQSGVKVFLQGNIVGFSGGDAVKHIKEIYREKGINYLLKELNGSYNILLLDSIRGLMYLFCDRYGSRPLFIYNDNNLFAFGSRVSELIPNLGKVPDINWKGIAQYLTFRFTLGENTFLKGITLIDNGVCYAFSLREKTITETKYWSYEHLTLNKDTTYQETVQKGKELFTAVFSDLSKDLRDMNICVGLSAGYDSRAIVAGLKKSGNPSVGINTLTTLHPCGPERDIVTELANSLEIKNTYVERPKDIYRRYYLKKARLADFLVQEHLWTMPMSEELSKYKTYVDGIAGDIIMRSTRVRPVHLKMYKDSAFLSQLFKKQFGFNYPWLRKYFDKNLWKNIEYSIEWVIEEFDKIKSTPMRMDVFLMKNRVRNGISLAPNNILGSYTENVYQPFFDTRLLEFGMTIPHEYKFDFVYRRILDVTYPNIANIASSSDETKEKLAKYDERIVKFEDNPRELVCDYADVASEDTNYLVELLEGMPEVPFLDKKSFIEDYRQEKLLHRLLTVLDLHIWWDSLIGGLHK